MASGQEEDDFLGFSDDEGDGTNPDSDYDDDEATQSLAQNAESEVNAHHIGDFEHNQQLPDLNEVGQEDAHECEVGPQHTSDSEELIYGTIRQAVIKFDYTRQTIRKIWQRAVEQKAAMDSYLCESRYHNCGRKRIQITYESIASIGMGDRTSIVDLAQMLHLSPTTVWRMVKRKQIKAHSSPLHPGILDECKVARMRWVLGLIMDYSIPNDPTYYSMYDFIHIDEKWFYFTQKSQRVYLANNEPFPHRKAKSRTKIPKFMFMAAVARPRWGQDGQSIKEKWPPHEGENVIYIIQDNAKAHILQNDQEWQQHCKQDGFTLILTQQPANSPDCNILDLGFFRSIQSLMHKKMPKTVEDLSGVVTDSFKELHPKTLSNVWMSLQYVGNEILKHKGDNNYQLPHNKKKVLEDEGNLPEQVKAPRWAVNECIELVEANQ
ncbi:uncharacterized protein [Spinacia oleracea]|uniref:Transposase n=1 Tax=Spinacia oleracea TaxID=3562 RepID=A0ABM3R3D9_SPIOL|nr:uncharacterized protein LOC130465415 [Spinacia oleracea]